MKQKIVQTALKICEKDGYDSFSMRKLATKLNLDPMAVYHYFASKEELTKAIVELIFHRFENKAMFNAKNPKQAFQKILVEYWNLFIEYPGLSLYLIKNSFEDFPSVVLLNEKLQDLWNAFGPGRNVEKKLDIIIDFVHGNALAFSMAPRKNGKGGKTNQNQKQFESSLQYLLGYLSQS
ncbi:TetR/AcrR family transcriptional regulator [Leptospira brenneri]|uniref:TetR/AcrR family transcriptional regulator n=1 Tax=Leptospira brenneri TaxID=2023182 RepID=A0A5F1Z5W3_9LEPT|nr:TetR/AcrR family transcriptional regulator [Leptospira brenneri]TGK92401.1 TetR/AcrR family transcriptional regulator [Leptospira brenneri]